MKQLTTKAIWLFAIGQLGWSLLAALITNWLVYIYQPDATAIAEGQTLFVPQGLVILGIATVIGGITALGRLFDAFTDPWIANCSDNSKNPKGRRIPFMKKIAVPFAVLTVLVFCAPVNGISGWNVAWLLVTLLLFYLCMTTYCTPYNALIPELSRTNEDRINISTYISVTFLLGSAIAYAAPFVWGALTPSVGRVLAQRITFAGMAGIALICLLVPVYCINESDYAKPNPAGGNAFASLKKTFANRQFCIFVGSDVLYWVALTIFQTGLAFFVTSLMHLPETMTTVLYIGMTLCSFACYLPVNRISKKMGKKTLVLIGFGGLSGVYLLTAISGLFGISGYVWGVVVVLCAAFPMAILGILPQAIVADIALSEAITTGENREGMFYAARTFAFKVGQSAAMILFTAFASIGTDGFGYRVAAAAAAILCLSGAAVLAKYNEASVMQVIEET